MLKDKVEAAKSLTKSDLLFYKQVQILSPEIGLFCLLENNDDITRISVRLTGSGEGVERGVGFIREGKFTNDSPFGPPLPEMGFSVRVSFQELQEPRGRM